MASTHTQAQTHVHTAPHNPIYGTQNFDIQVPRSRCLYQNLSATVLQRGGILHSLQASVSRKEIEIRE